MKTIVLSCVVAVLWGGDRGAQAGEVLLGDINCSTLSGEWEGAWRDRVAERLVVVRLVVRPKEVVLTLVSGPANPFVEPFRISPPDCRNGHVDLQGLGFGDAEGASIRASGVGWALASDGVLDVTAAKTTKNGKKIVLDLRLVKMQGGFFKEAQQLSDAARRQEDRSAHDGRRRR